MSPRSADVLAFTRLLERAPSEASGQFTLENGHLVIGEEDALKEEKLTFGTVPRTLQYIKIVCMVTFRCGTCLLPSFLRPISQPTSDPILNRLQTPSQPQSLEFLSGLRGVASVIVFIFHFAHGSYPGMDYTYGEGDSNYYFLQLPIIRIFYAAEAMVALFFVISGYALSRHCVTHLRNGRFDNLFVAISSLAFRRAMRLFFPAITSSFLVYLAQRTGLMPSKGLPLDYEPNFVTDTRSYIRYLGKLLDVWTWDIDLIGWWYNPQLWTIPVEFRCSMVLFLHLVATARCRTSLRLLLDMAIAAQCMLTSRWDVALFIVGKLIAELEAIHKELSKNQKKDSRQGAALASPIPRCSAFACQLETVIFRFLLVIVFVVGLLLASYPPSPSQEAPFYSFLSALVHHNRDGRRIYYALAAPAMLVPLIFMPALQRPFNSSFARYLGRISYALYLVHGPMIRVVGGRILKWAWSISGTKRRWTYNTGFAITSLLLTPVIVWAADLFERGVDARCIKLAKWVEEITMGNTALK
ncbi:MAG: hypothetical protein MMC33_006778 [Icmadophila ericetorum]|nr:hypothetical protein [Icmadophila ericetorum]